VSASRDEIRAKLLALDPAERRKLARSLAPIRVPYVPVQISPKQEIFLRLAGNLEVFYGGAGGGGKSVALLMGALRWVHIPRFSALLLRRTFPELSQRGGLMDIARRWLKGSDAKFYGNGSREYPPNTWVFPSGATITFGHVAQPGDEENYMGGEYQYIAFDELSAFTESMYRFLFSRLRRAHGVDVPLQMRSASNPGGPGHVWCKKRFIDPRTRPPGTLFVPASISDNPGLDATEYRKSLSNLPALLRAQIEHGDWSAVQEGAMFVGALLEIVDRLPLPSIGAVRAWDIARTKPRPGRTDPDHTVGVRLDRLSDNRIAITRLTRLRESPKFVREAILDCVRRDGPVVPVWLEMEGGGLAGIAIESLQREVSDGALVSAQTPGADKTNRAQPWSNAWMNGQVLMRRAGWNDDLIDEHESFPAGEHDDIVDACSLALSKLPQAPSKEYLESEWTAHSAIEDPLAMLTVPVNW
jgi:predicted phage terminase large subunit-like protein